MRPVPQSLGARGALFLACAALLSACRGAPVEARSEAPVAPPQTQPPPPPETGVPLPAPEPENVREAAQTALAAGDIAATRAALDALVTAPLLEACEAHLDAGRVEEALAAAEEALATSPDLPAALWIAGACRARLALAGDGSTFDAVQMKAALELLSRARGCAGALGTASELARELGELEAALELARAGLAPAAGACADVARVASLARPSVSPARALAAAALAAWRARRAQDAADAARLFEEALAALSRAIADDERDAWAWRTLGEAYLDAGRPADARAALENALERLGADDALFALVDRAARSDGGTAELVRVFARLQGRHPQAALAWWYPGLEQFEAALRGAPQPLSLLLLAERDLRTCRAKDPSRASQCLELETLCRSARGWAELAQGEHERAWNEFRSVGELVEGGWFLERPPLRSAGDGLNALIERHLSRGELEGALRAAEALAAAARDDVRVVRRAADLARDLGDRLQLLERDLKLAARGRMRDPVRLEELRVEIGTSRPGDDLRGTARERDLFFEIGDRRGRAARETYLRALEHYRRALELTPDDLELGCDAARLVVRRLATRERAREFALQVDWAERLLLRLVEVGRKKLEDGAPDAAQRYALDEAWGDAHQILGELFLGLRAQPRAAREWFERALAIGPVPRSEISDTWLPLCLEAEAEGARR
jgi:tetratricopeptide (TPR) repeat protein